MGQSFIGEIKKLDVLIGKKMYQCKKSKDVDTIPSPFQMKILEYLICNEDNNINQKDLEEELKVSKAAISGTIKSMEENGLIKRKQSIYDARAKELVVTRKGKEEFEKMVEIFNSADKEISKKLTKEERKEFIDIIKKLQKELELDLEKNKERKK